MLEENKIRLVKILENVPSSEAHEGWECVGGVAISDFVGFGFSKKRNNVALVV